MEDLSKSDLRIMLRDVVPIIESVPLQDPARRSSVTAESVLAVFLLESLL